MSDNNIIHSKEVYHILVRALDILDDKIMQHGEITGYILYKMLQTEGDCSVQELAEYTLIGTLHDIGMIKTGYSNSIVDGELKGAWAHSIYGYLFLRYLSPISDKAEIVLYHHLAYNKHKYIRSQYIKIAEYLTLADKLDMYTRMEGHQMGTDYFTKYKDIIFSSKAMELLNKAQAKFHIMEQLQTGTYKQELDELFAAAHFAADYKKHFLEMLIYAIDFRSKQTVLHTFATTTFAVEIGKLMALTEEELHLLYYGALLHDIGKIAIPVSILEAPRKLTDQEMRIMRAHVVISEKILKGVINEQVMEIAIRHHEKLDGSGYHRGLTEADLTVPQRIVAIADILSALYARRSYKDAFDTQKITQLLHTDAAEGKLCPDIVAVCLVHLNSIIDGYEQIKNEKLSVYMTIMEQYEYIYEKFKIYDTRQEPSLSTY